MTYAEPLSPPNEQEALEESLVTSRFEADNQREQDWRNEVHEPTPESPVMQSVISFKVESGFNSSKPAFNAEEKHMQIPSEETAAYRAATEERSAPFLGGTDKDADVPAEKRETYLHPTPFDAWVEPVQALGDTSDSETEAVLEPTVGSNTSGRASEGEPEASIFDQVVFNPEENASGIHADGPLLHKVQSDVEDKLYPDGEEMDTWDSVIERKVALKKDQSLEMDTQHAEPEDMSAREPGQQEVAKVNVVEEEHVHSSLRKFKEEHVNSSLIVTPTGAQFSDNNQDQIPLLEQGQENVNNEEEDEEDEDSQNVSVSWRTEVESDSYAQDNTLADTRPLIQYKSDETDRNNQASHCDDLESSDGEDKMEAGCTGSGTWSDSKSKRFGTMDDLCEETDEDGEKVGFDMSYAHSDQDVVTKEHAALRTDCDEEKEQVQMIMKVDQEHSHEETEDLTQMVIPKIYSNVNMDYSEDLEDVDRLVELELEGLSTSTYTAHFAQHQNGKSELATSIQEATPQGAGERIGEEMSIRVEPSMKAHQELISTSTIINSLNEQPFPDEDQEARNTLEITENHDSNAPMVTHTDAIDDESVAIDFNGGFDGQEDTDDLCLMEQPNGSGDESPNVSPYPHPVPTELGSSDLQDALVEATVYHELHKAETVEESEAPPRHSADVNTDQQVCSVAEQIIKWECIGSPAEATGQFAAGESCENVEATTERHLDFPESIQDKRDILQVKSSTESIKTHFQIEKDLHSFSCSDVDADFWGSSVLTGANYPPTSSYHEATGEVSPNHSQGEDLVLGNLDKQHVAMEISRIEGGSATGQVTKGEFEQRSSERELYGGKDAAEEGLTHSEDSGKEDHSWSSGEE